jgi:phosphatidate cytidylyltransferase
MLSTRLWMGSLLAAVGLFILIVDEALSPWYPGWFVLTIGLGLVTGRELVRLLGPKHNLPFWYCLGGILFLLISNWLAHLRLPTEEILPELAFVGTAFIIFFLATFLREMAVYREPGHAIVRLSLCLWIVGYLGLLPSFVVQLRWFPAQEYFSTVALVLAIFVPKCCDIGAYFAGRYLGRTRMTPALSPKKTWEGALGGLLLAVIVTIAIDRLAPVSPLNQNWWLEIGFGLSVGGFGILGDLAESLIKRDCQQKDASDVVPGFGGVLDVIDAILFAAPVSYLWLRVVAPLFP